MGLSEKEVLVSHEKDSIQLVLAEKTQNLDDKSVMIYCYMPSHIFNRDRELLVRAVRGTIGYSATVKKSVFYRCRLLIVRQDTLPEKTKLFIYKVEDVYYIKRFISTDIPEVIERYNKDLNYVFEEIG
jgi:dTDP-4-dehydrorhamnose 3,5-epimerase-like enzyme